MDKMNVSFDGTKLHPRAAESVDRAGQRLLTYASISDLPIQKPPAFPSRRKPVANINSGDIVGKIRASYTDYSGKTIGRYFVIDGQEIGLFDEGYRELRLVADKVLSIKPFSSGFSVEFIEDCIFDWWEDAYQGEVQCELSVHITSLASEAFSNYRVLVPLSALEIEKAFRLDDVLISPFDPKIIEDMRASLIKKVGHESASVKKHCDDLLQQMGHLACVIVEVSGERKFAKEFVENLAFDVASMFRFMSPASSSWDINFQCFPLGSENIQGITSIMLEKEVVAAISQRVISGGTFNWRLDFNTLDRLMRMGYCNFSRLICFGDKSDFENRVYSSIKAFSNAAASSVLSDRLIYAMSALDGIFLRSEGESIQTSVADRVSFLIESDPDARLKVSKNFKSAYGLRSRAVHHLKNVQDEDVLRDFFINAHRAIFRCLQLMPRFKTKGDFLDHLERVKFGQS